MDGGRTIAAALVPFVRPKLSRDAADNSIEQEKST